MKLRLIVLFFMLATLLPACEEAADIANSKLYDKAGVSFQYPGNWTVSEDEGSAMYRNIFVESPGDALMIIQSMDVSVEQDLMEYAKSYAQMSSEASTIAKVSKSKYTKKDPYVLESLDFTVLTETVPHQRKYQKVKGLEKIYYLISQSAVDDLQKTQAGFALIFGSFKGQ